MRGTRIRQSTGAALVSVDTSTYVHPMPHTPGVLTAALAALWNAIAAKHAELPPHAVVAMASHPQSPRHGAERWSIDDDGCLVGLSVSTDVLAEGDAAVITHVLHEAAHVLCWRRGVNDTSSRGVYHNGAFREAAEEVGLVWARDAERVPGKGWSDGTWGSTVAGRLADVIAEVQPAIDATLPYLAPMADTPARSRVDRLVAMCECDPPRRITVSRTILDLGPVICGICGSKFQARAQED